MNPKLNREQEYDNLLDEMGETPAEMTQMSPQTVRRARKHRIVRRLLAIPSTAIALVLVLAAVVNISPAAAYALEGLPVLGQVAAVVNFSPPLQAQTLSPSLQAAVEHDFAQNVNQEQVVRNITARIDYVIVDRMQINIFYTLYSPVHTHLDSRIRIRHADNAVSSPYGTWFISSMQAVDNYRPRMVTIPLHGENAVPSRLIVEINATTSASTHGAMQHVSGIYAYSRVGQTSPSAMFTFELELDQALSEQGETIVLDYDFMLDGRSMTLTNVQIYPTQMRVTFANNTGSTVWPSLAGVYVVNEHGEKFANYLSQTTTVVTSSGASAPHVEMTITLQSPFFSEREQLTLFIREINRQDAGMGSRFVQLDEPIAIPLR